MSSKDKAKKNQEVKKNVGNATNEDNATKEDVYRALYTVLMFVSSLSAIVWLFHGNNGLRGEWFIASVGAFLVVQGLYSIVKASCKNKHFVFGIVCTLVGVVLWVLSLVDAIKS